MIVMTLSPHYGASSARQDAATAEWNGQRFEAVSRHGALMALARRLIDAGCPDLPWEAGRPGKRDLFGSSLHRLGRLTVGESDSGSGPVIRRWSQNTHFPMQRLRQDGAGAENYGSSSLWA